MPRSLTMPKHRIPSFTSLLSPKVRRRWGAPACRCAAVAAARAAARRAWQPWCRRCGVLSSTAWAPVHSPARPADHKHPQQEGHSGCRLGRAAPRVLYCVAHRTGPPAQGADMRGKWGGGGEGASCPIGAASLRFGLTALGSWQGKGHRGPPHSEAGLRCVMRCVLAAASSRRMRRPASLLCRTWPALSARCTARRRRWVAIPPRSSACLTGTAGGGRRMRPAPRCLTRWPSGLKVGLGASRRGASTCSCRFPGQAASSGAPSTQQADGHWHAQRGRQGHAAPSRAVCPRAAHPACVPGLQRCGSRWRRLLAPRTCCIAPSWLPTRPSVRRRVARPPRC